MKNKDENKGGYYHLPGMHYKQTILSNGRDPRAALFQTDAVEVGSQLVVAVIFKKKKSNIAIYFTIRVAW